MSDISERAAREIEALLKKEDLYIDGGDLRDILAEEFEKGGDAPSGEIHSISNAAPTVQSPSAAERLLDRQDADHAKYIDWATRELKAQIADRHRLQNELIEAQGQLAAERKRTLDWAREHSKDCPVCGAKAP